MFVILGSINIRCVVGCCDEFLVIFIFFGIINKKKNLFFKIFFFIYIRFIIIWNFVFCVKLYKELNKNELIIFLENFFMEKCGFF